jgi:hypothetical protein
MVVVSWSRQRNADNYTTTFTKDCSSPRVLSGAVPPEMRYFPCWVAAPDRLQGVTQYHANRRCYLPAHFTEHLAAIGLRYISSSITGIWLLLQLLLDRSGYQSRACVESRWLVRMTSEMKFRDGFTEISSTGWLLSWFFSEIRRVSVFYCTTDAQFNQDLSMQNYFDSWRNGNTTEVTGTVTNR